MSIAGTHRLDTEEVMTQYLITYTDRFSGREVTLRYDTLAEFARMAKLLAFERHSCVTVSTVER